MGAADEVVALFDARGAEHHGEVVDQTSHALQCAAEAQRRGAHDALVAACLLHDIGHLLAAEADGPRADLASDDDHHEAVGARWLARRFGPSVARPVALHVVAKRWRCTTDPAYHDALSAASQATLVAQGGLLDAEEVARFERAPGFADAVVLRECDEAAKEPGRATPDLASFVPLLERLAAEGPGR
jgi:phosphonate degradation associated HDIG domain protein